MKECLYCKKEFEPITERRKFCKDSCRVMYNRKYGKKDEIKPFQMKALYNELMEAISELKLGKQYKSFDNTHGIITTTNPQEGTVKISKEHYYKPAEKSFQQHMNDLPELIYEDEYRKKSEEIEAATNLSRKQKDLLHLNMKQSKL